MNVALPSCNRGVLYKKYITLPDQVWDYRSPVAFRLNVQDTINRYNIYVSIRNADNYEYSNLYLFIDIAAPTHTHTRDTLECILAAPSGRWLGQGLGDIWDNKILFRRNIHFPKAGEYDFTFTQAMREDKLEKIMDVGLTVERANYDSR